MKLYTLDLTAAAPTLIDLDADVATAWPADETGFQIAETVRDPPTLVVYAPSVATEAVLILSSPEDSPAETAAVSQWATDRGALFVVVDSGWQPMRRILLMGDGGEDQLTACVVALQRGLDALKADSEAATAEHSGADA